MRFTVCVVLVLLTLGYISCSVSWKPVDTEIVNGKLVIFCKHDNVRLVPGEEYNDNVKCVKCACDETGLGCQSSVGTITAPENSKCISVTKSCKNHWVLRTNTNQPCPSSQIPIFFSAKGK